jgi:multimeric flavodoxin WrbA
MRITILNGNPDGRNKDFDLFIEKLSIFLEKEQHKVKHLKLRGMDIKPCTGCWGCWVRTPGECLTPDDSRVVCDESINCDLLLFASPIIMGFVSAVLKKAMEKMIPLIHPYIELVHKECHHRRRYDKYPRLGLLLDKTDQADDEDIAITVSIFERVSLNFKSQLSFVGDTTKPIQEVIDEINTI